MSFPWPPRRLTLFMGHYGSGKTSIAVNYALGLARQGKRTAIADLDIVNPYFRTADSRQELEAEGVRLIASGFASSNVDLPSISSESYALVEGRDEYGVLDVGGDDRGALALGRFSHALLQENDYDAFFVMNKARPLTGTVDEAVEVARQIEAACGIPFTGIINNSNIGDETTREYVEESASWAKRVSQALCLRLVGTAVRRGLGLRGDGVFEIGLRRFAWQR